MAKANINPFAVATSKAPAAAKPKNEVIVAGAVLDTAGAELYPASAVIEAMDNFAVGKGKYDEGDAMMKTNRPIIDAFGLQTFAERFLDQDRVPDSSKLTTKRDGSGTTMTYIVINKQMNLNPAEFAEFSSLVGAAAAHANVEDRNVFTLKSDTLETEVECKDVKGKPVKKSVQDHLIDALQLKFADSPEILANLFEVKPIFKTTPDLLHKGLGLVASNRDKNAVHRLQAFTRVIKAITQVKLGK